MKSSHQFKWIYWGIFFFFLFTGCATTQQETVKPQSFESQPNLPKITNIQKISFQEEEKYTRISIEGSEAISPPFFKLVENPLRIVIDIPNSDVSNIKEAIKIENGTISEVMATQYDEKGRVEITLLQMTNYNITREEKNLLIDVEKIKKIEEAKQLAETKESLKEETPKEESPKEAASGEEPPKEESQVKEPVAKETTLPAPEPSQPPSPPAQVSQKAKEIIDINFEEKADFTAFNILADGKIENYNAFQLESPARLVLDIWGVSTHYPKKSIPITNPYIKKVRIGLFSDKVRLVFDSTKSKFPPYQINRMDSRLTVSIGNVPQTSESQIIFPETGKVIATSTTSPSVKEKPSLPEGQKRGKANALIGIDFKQMDNKSRIILWLAEEPVYEIKKVSENTLAIDIKNASAPKHLCRGLDTKEFESAVNYIDIQNVKVRKTIDLRILIKLREETPYEASQEGRILFVDIERPKKVEAKVEVPPGVLKKEELKEKVKEEEIKEEIKKEEVKVEVKEEISKEVPKEAEKEEVKSPLPPPVAKKGEEALPGEKIYTGRKISLDFKDADIKNILRLIAEVSNFNIITSDDVSGKITMRLVDVPWDQALDVILQSRNLGMVQVGNVIRIAPQETLNRENQARLEAKRAKEKLEDLITELIPVNYATAKDIIPQVKGILSERGDVKVDERTNTLIVKDIPKNIAPIKDLVKALDTKTPQILIEARIVEANLTFQRELGVKWGFQLGGGKAAAGGGLEGTTLGETTREVVDLPAVARTGAGTGTATSGIIEFLFSRGTIQQLDFAISAHENKGDVKIISSPKIATLNNREAYIEQGLRIPYIKYTAEGTATVDFIEANLKLTVTPHVTNDGHIKLSIKVKKDAPDTSIIVLGTPSIDKKEAVSEVLIRDNGVVAIAGVYSISKSAGKEGIPLFNKIPLLGWLFKREAKEDSRKDLLIFISPKIIKDQV
ncbi:MAG: type IV pilus secretin PilQ [Thermodesulfobacteriota bacterium]